MSFYGYGDCEYYQKLKTIYVAFKCFYALAKSKGFWGFKGGIAPLQVGWFGTKPLS